MFIMHLLLFCSNQLMFCVQKQQNEKLFSGLNLRVARTLGTIFEKKKYDAVHHIFCTNYLLSD